MKFAATILLLIFAETSFGQNYTDDYRYFESASAEFDVPVPLLEAIAFIQTRWTQITYTRQELMNRQPDIQPPAYGIMGLRDDGWFGHSLDSASILIGLPADTLKQNTYENIRGASALLSEYRREAESTSGYSGQDLSSWAPIIARFSGIPQANIATEFAYHTLQYLNAGVSENGIVITAQPVNLSGFPESVKEKGLWVKQKQSVLKRPESTSGSGADYPGATWNPSENYSSRNGAPIAFVIIHDTEGSFDASVSWLQNPAAEASAHYIIRSADGYIEQLVHERDEAWGVVCWNPITISIEHEGYVANPSYFTEAMYESSAHLTQYLCEKYNIAEDSLHVFGHNAWSYPWFNLIPFASYTQYVGSDYATCNDHTDPGQYWNWHHYFDLIRSYDSTQPALVASSPSAQDSSVAAYADIALTFNEPMDPVTTAAATSITPAISGQASWNLNGTQLTFAHPDSLMKWSTTYTVKVDTAAKGSNGRSLVAPYVAQFTTVPPDTTGPALVTASPGNGGVAVSKTYFEFVFNEPVNLTTLPSRISLGDSTGKKISVSKDQFVVTPNGYTLVALRSAANLIPGMRYTASVSPGIEDYYGNPSRSSYSTTFTIDTSESTGGILLDGFEPASGMWLQPSGSALTTGVDTNASSFALSFRSYDGSSSGEITYSFESNSAFCAVENSPGYEISGAYSVGMWIFGDDSRNELDFVFGSSSEHAVPVDTLDWYGWKFVSMWRSDSDASTNTLRGIAIRRLSGNLFESGTIYVDDIKYDGKVTGIETQQGTSPNKIVLDQNYPNPFNPSTVISYHLAGYSHVTLDVYDVLGREVAALTNSNQSAGSHDVQFDADRLSSGVYIYRLTVNPLTKEGGVYSETRKMLIVK